MSVAADIFGAIRDGGNTRGGAVGHAERGVDDTPRAPAADTRRRGLRRPDADTGRRPGGRPMTYGRARVAASTSPHRPVDPQEVGWGAVVITALSTALVLAGFLGLAQWRAGDVAPESTPVVQVRVDDSAAGVGEWITAVGAETDGAAPAGGHAVTPPTVGD